MQPETGHDTIWVPSQCSMPIPTHTSLSTFFFPLQHSRLVVLHPVAPANIGPLPNSPCHESSTVITLLYFGDFALWPQPLMYTNFGFPDPGCPALPLGKVSINSFFCCQILPYNICHTRWLRCLKGCSWFNWLLGCPCQKVPGSLHPLIHRQCKEVLGLRLILFTSFWLWWHCRPVEPWQPHGPMLPLPFLLDVCQQLPLQFPLAHPRVATRLKKMVFLPSKATGLSLGVGLQQQSHGSTAQLQPIAKLQWCGPWRGRSHI